MMHQQQYGQLPKKKIKKASKSRPKSAGKKRTKAFNAENVDPNIL